MGSWLCLWTFLLHIKYLWLDKLAEWSAVRYWVIHIDKRLNIYGQIILREDISYFKQLSHLGFG